MFKVGQKVKIKSIEKCLEEGYLEILSEDDDYTVYGFKNVKENPSLSDDMLHFFDQIGDISYIDTNCIEISIKISEERQYRESWWWPNEVLLPLNHKQIKII